MREASENSIRDDFIKITEYSYDVYYAFHKYLYTDSIDIETEKAMDLLVWFWYGLSTPSLSTSPFYRHDRFIETAVFSLFAYQNTYPVGAILK
jgi:hypothetical protein